MLNISEMITETQNENTLELDTMSTLDIVTIMNAEDATVAEAVNKVLPAIAKAAELAAEAISSGGRMVYVGAGTSGRLAMLDAVECEPTFGISPDKVVAVIAGGATAFKKAKEGAEDDENAGISDLRDISLQPEDCVVGIAASGRTPYVCAALRYAGQIGCHTVSVSCNTDAPVSDIAEIPIEVIVGPEVLTGSTRLKAGTAQKMILNMISTAAMVRCGRVYKNLMVDVRHTNEKLNARALHIVMTATGADLETAKRRLNEAGGETKLAITAILSGKSTEKAKIYLQQAEGHVRKALELARNEG